MQVVADVLRNVLPEGAVDRAETSQKASKKGATEKKGFFRDLVEVFTAGGPGSILNAGLDKLGFPDWVGDIAGMALDIAIGNVPGALANGMDALEDVANAAGNEELGAMLKTGSSIANLFSPGKVPTDLGSQLGQLQNIVGHMETTVSMADNLQQGNPTSALLDAVSLFGNAGSPELMAMPDKAQELRDKLQGTMETARLVQTGGMRPETAGLGLVFDGFKALVENPPGSPLEFFGQVFDIVLPFLQTDQTVDAQKARERFEGVVGLIHVASEDRDAFDKTIDAFQRVLVMYEDVDLATHQATDLKM